VVRDIVGRDITVYAFKGHILNKIMMNSIMFYVSLLLNYSRLYIAHLLMTISTFHIRFHSEESPHYLSSSGKYSMVSGKGRQEQQVKQVKAYLRKKKTIHSLWQSSTVLQTFLRGFFGSST
jgi:capsule polysaccharide export protein KpsE/RkpR